MSCNAPSILVDAERYALYADASGRSSLDFGNRPECDRIEASSNPKAFPKQCTISDSSGLFFGICAPPNCDEDSFREEKTGMDGYVKSLSLTFLGVNLTSAQINCGNNALPLDGSTAQSRGSIATIAAFGFLLLVVVVATIVRGFLQPPRKKQRGGSGDGDGDGGVGGGYGESLLSIQEQQYGEEEVKLESVGGSDLEGAGFYGRGVEVEEVEEVDEVEEKRMEEWKPYMEKEFNLLLRILLCFSASDNFDSLLKVRGGGAADRWGVLDGVRVLSISMVILGHSALLMLSFGIRNVLGALPPNGLLGTATAQPIQQAEFAVDSFFMLSGFLAGAVLLPKLREAAEQGWGKLAGGFGVALLHRWLRLAPLVGATILIYRFVVPAAGYGPLFYPVSHPTYTPPGQGSDYVAPGTACDKWWWTNMLFVNNLVPFKNNFNAECSAWMWYLANDYQFFFLLTLIAATTSLFRMPHYATGVIFALLALGSCIAATVVADKHHLTNFIMAPPPQNHKNQERGDYQNLYYVRPWMRIPPYSIGICLAVLWIATAGPNGPKSRPKVPFSKFTGFLLIAIAGAIISVLMYIPATYYTYPAPPPFLSKESADYHPTSVWTPAAETFWVAWSRPIFSLALATIVGVCMWGAGGFVNSILAAPLWQPLAKLTFGAYLIHIPIITVLYGSREAAFSYNSFLLTSIFPGTWILTYGAAALLMLLVEKPFMNLEAMVMKSKSK